MILPLSALRDANACAEQYAIVAREWPDGIPLTDASADRAVALGLDIGWASDLFTDAEHVAYEAQLAPILAAYLAQRAPIDAAYRAQLAPIWAAYVAQRAPIYTDYLAKIAPIWAAYEAQLAPIDAAYEAQLAHIIVSVLRNRYEVSDATIEDRIAFGEAL